MTLRHNNLLLGAWNRVLLCALLCLQVSAVLACEPQDALRYHSPVTDSLEQQSAKSKGLWEALRVGLRSVVEANQVRGKSGGTLGVTWQAQPLQTIEAYQDWEATSEAVREARCADVYAALTAYAKLRGAELHAAAATLRQEQSAMTKTEMERKQTLGAVIALEVTAQAIALETNTQLAQQAAKGLELARAKAAAYGLVGSPSEENAVFRTEEAPVDKMPLWKKMLRESQRQRVLIGAAKREQGIAYELGVDDNRSDVQLSAKASTRGPKASMTMGYPSLYDPYTLVYAPGITFSVRINYPLDPAGRAEIKLAEAQEATMLRQREQQRAALAARQQETMLQVRTSLVMLAGTQSQADLAKQLLELKQTQLDAGLTSKQAVMDAHLKRLEAQISVVEAWSQHIDAVYQHLELTDGHWEISK